MAIKTLITTFGRRKIAQALANEDTVEVTAMVFGDGDGSQYTPTVSQTQLKNQLYSTAAIATVEDEVWTYFQATIPSTVNGFTIREIGLTCYNEDTQQDELIIVASVPDTEKAVSENGVQQTMPIRIGVTTAIGNVLTVIADPDSIPPFTNRNLGLIKGRVYDGYVQARDGDTGYGYVTGWDNVFKKISSNPQIVNSDVVVSLGNTIYFIDSNGVQQNLIDVSENGIRLGDKDTPLNLASTSNGVNIYSNWEGTGVSPRKILTEFDLKKRVTNYIEDITDKSSYSAGAYKKIGNPTESEGIISGFTDNDYIILDASLPENTSSEIKTKFTTGSNVTTKQSIFDSKNTFFVGIENGKFIYSLGQGYRYSVHGSPTIVDSELSNFSSSNYATLSNIPAYKHSFELLTKFTTGSDVTTKQAILDSKNTNFIGIENGKFIYSLGQGNDYGVRGDIVQLSNKTVSNFSTTNYIELPVIDLNSSGTWEIKLKFTTSPLSSKQTIFSYSPSDSSISIELFNNQIGLKLSSNGSTFDICDTQGISSLSYNTTYYVRLKFTGTSYILYLSTDNSSWSTEITVNSTDPVYESSKISRLGIGKNLDYPFLGSIDLSGCIIKLGSSTEWSYPDSDYTVVGNITKNGITNFSLSNYINLPTMNFNSVPSWEMVFKFTTGVATNTIREIFAYGNNNTTNEALSIELDKNFKIHLVASSATTSFTICNTSGNTVLSPNTTYYVRAKFTGTKYTLELSTNGQNWVTEISVASTLRVYSGNTARIGAEIYDETSDESFATGSIDLSESYISLNNGSYVWGYVKMIEDSGITEVQPNTTYYIKEVFLGSSNEILYSTDGFTWASDYSITNSSSACSKNNPIYIGTTSSQNRPFTGSIDLGNTYIIADDTDVYKPLILYKGVGSLSVSPNTTYYIRGIYNGVSHILQYSTDGSTWTIDYSLSNSYPIYSNYNFYVGDSDDLPPFKGSVDLLNTEIRANGETVWSKGLNSITLPPCVIFSPAGRDENDNVKSQKYELNGGTYLINSLNDSMEITENTSGEFSVFFNTSTGSIQIAKNYAKWTDIEPESSEIGDVWYKLDNFMYHTASVGANFIPSETVSVTNEGVITGLGYLNLTKNLPISNNPEWNTCFLTGSNVTTLQNLWTLPYTTANIENGYMNIDVYSYSYEVVFTSIVYSGAYLLNNSSYSFTVNAGNEITLYTNNYPAYGTTLYSDASLTTPYAKVIESNPSELLISFYSISSYSTHTFTADSPDEYFYIKNDPYNSEKILLHRDSSYPINEAGCILYDSNNNYYATITSYTSLSNFEIFSATQDTVTALQTNVSYSSTDYTTYYSHSINGSTYYSYQALEVGTLLYTDSGLSTLYGIVTNVDTSNSTVTIGSVGTPHSIVNNVDVIRIYVINSTDTVYTKNSELMTNTLIYSDPECNTYYGFATDVTGSQVTINSTYQNVAMSNYSTVYEYTMGSSTYYTVDLLAMDVPVYSDATLETLFGTVTSISLNSCTISAGSEELGYVEYYGDSGDFVPADITIPGSVSPLTIPIYEDADLTRGNTTSTGSNAIYTGVYYSSIMHTFSAPVLASTRYIVNLTFNQFTDNAPSELILTVNDTSYTQACNIRRINNIVDYLQLGGVEGFNGTFYLRNPNNTNVNITYLTDSWEWNGHIDEFADWEVTSLAELGSVTIDAGKITDFKMNHALEIAKVEDLKSMTVETIINNYSSTTNISNAYTPIGDPIFTFSKSIDTSKEIWLRGQTVSRTEYSNLFNIYGTSFGAGDGKSTFKLPNFTNKTIWGSDSSLGEVSSGLPNIIGYASGTETVYKDGSGWKDAYSQDPTRFGAFRRKSNIVAGKSDQNVAYDNDLWGFDASRYNSIYGKSSIVQPPAVKIYVKTRYK